MNSKTSKLLLDIARCPNVKLCLKHPNTSHPCSKIVSSQNTTLNDFHLPEPWNGDIQNAPILFISSNPSINAEEIYPLWSWSDVQVIDNFSNRFDENWVKVENNRYYPKLVDGTYAKANTYWGKVRNHAKKILQRKVIAGKDFAITEVVHCKSVGEIGVKDAVFECSMYISSILDIARAKIMVVVGKKAEVMVKNYLGLPENKNRFINAVGRYWVFVDHSYTPYVLIEKALSPFELNQIRNAAKNV